MTVTVTVTVTARVILFTYLRLKDRVAEQGYVNTVVKQFKVKIQYKIKYNKKDNTKYTYSAKSET